jgi:hypothetical protein
MIISSRWLLLSLSLPAWCGGTLSAAQQKILDAWLATQPDYRQATDADCACDIDIRQMRDGYGNPKYALPDYHPFVATGDFNDDGIEDFAVALIPKTNGAAEFTLAIFNGPATGAPAFTKSGFDLARDRLFYFGAARAKPYRLAVAPFNSDFGDTLVPFRGTYRIR